MKIEQNENWVVLKKFDKKKEKEIINSPLKITNAGFSFGKVVSAPENSKIKKGDAVVYMKNGEYIITIDGKEFSLIEKQLILCKYE